MVHIYHNLPDEPYKKFFGRQESIEKMWETLIEGGTFIASIDGVGGIGKTALAYYFCKEILIPRKVFDYIVWFTVKDTVFDPFSNEQLIKRINVNFRGVEGLIDTILGTVGFEDIIQNDFNEKKNFLEDEILGKEKIFIVIDNIETIEDDTFFSYITKDFNRISYYNRNLKILTTSRKRKKIADFPIEIEGLQIEDALKMLKYLAKEYKIKDIINATDHDNIKLLEKVGCIPLGIEFIIGQMSLGKSREQIYHELQGYPSLQEVRDEQEKKKRLSDIILFSFKNMYESLSEDQKKVFKIITALIKNKAKSDPPISFELLLSISDFKKQDLENAINVLLDNNLIIHSGSNEYSMHPMAVNFVRQYYEDFEHIEDQIIEIKNRIKSNMKMIDKTDKIEMFINRVRELIEDNKFEEAEEKLLNCLDIAIDHRLYLELARVQRTLNKYSKAEDSFKNATLLNPKNVNAWFEWIQMEDNRSRHSIALQLTEEAMEKTNFDVSIVAKRLSFIKFKKNFEQFRNEAEKFYKMYKKENRKEDSLKILRIWKNFEYNLIREELRLSETLYFKVVDELIEMEEEFENKIQLSQEALRVANRLNNDTLRDHYNHKIKKLKKSVINNISHFIKELNINFNNKNYDKAKKEARRILNLICENENIYEQEKYKQYAKNALRVLLQILSSEKDYDRIRITFEDYKEIGYTDKNCIDIYEKSQREKLKEEHNKIISKIMYNIQEIEFGLRKIIMWILDDNEEKLINIVEIKGKSDWIEQWKLTKNKSLKKDEMLIHYSDISHLRSLLSWLKKDLLSKVNDNNKRQVEEFFQKIVQYLENYITKLRNEAFHSRLQLYNMQELNEVLVDTERTNNEIKNLTSLIM